MKISLRMAWEGFFMINATLLTKTDCWGTIKNLHTYHLLKMAFKFFSVCQF